jgi:hypothetical protein
MRRVILAVVFFISGCAPALVCDKQTIRERLVEIERKHGVEIEIKSFSNKSGLCELLGIIDKDLEICPQYFKENIGPIFIEKSFDELGIEGMFLAGYVDAADIWENYPVHVKNRSVLEKVLFPVPREKDVFLHEASHSFELNIKDISDKWEVFCKEFNEAQTRKYSETAFLSRTFLPELIRPDSMPSVYGSANHYEDFAETHCYLRRNNIELIKDKDPTLYKKCKIVERFTDPYGS